MGRSDGGTDECLCWMSRMGTGFVRQVFLFGLIYWVCVLARGGFNRLGGDGVTFGHWLAVVVG